MSERWPHLLKAFWVLDVVVRKGSFSTAANYLNVSQSAVSQQIKLLEEEFGPLFERHGKQIVPTDLCRRFVSHLRKGFTHIEEGVAVTNRCCNQITVTVLPSFGGAWLVPRLYKFTEKYPDIEVRLAMSDMLSDFTDGGVDAGIRLGGGDYPDLIAKQLCEDELFLVCSQSMREEFPEEPQYSDLKNFLLIHDNARESQNWPAWVAATGEQNIPVKSRVMISDSSQAIRLALGGRGVLLVRRLLVADELASGAMVKLFDTSVRLKSRYFFVMPKRSRGNPALTAFYEWLVEEMEPYQIF
ncbi:transcriptional regulator [Hahella sp. CCB-MM4]|uniref:LysR substrate-binding domain-containing protein n=1 Tax=Hahella sp. (strain CCB-MM4) TaxID=1926491 RepID=UPI000B9B0D1A|nr:LysR substrate-binding domain-containing protein [Hahella sp. CCB-MM4]OZG70828.1 transcriptional regulator [Hahella sp. CCB-MM4]